MRHHKFWTNTWAGVEEYPSIYIDDMAAIAALHPLSEIGATPL